MNPYERSSKPSTGALTNDKTHIKTATASCVRNASDYICEVSIPWTEKGNHKAGDWLGFNFTINDDMDENGSRDYYVSWANPSYQRYWDAPDLPIVELAGNAPAKPTTKPNTNTSTKAPDTPAKTTAASQAEASSEPEDVSSEEPGFFRRHRHDAAGVQRSQRIQRKRHQTGNHGQQQRCTYQYR